MYSREAIINDLFNILHKEVSNLKENSDNWDALERAKEIVKMLEILNTINK